MALLGSAISNEVGLRLLLCPVGSNIVVRTACCGVGVVLPVYSTFKAIESRDRCEQEKWLLYWAAYGSFSIVEVLSDKILYWFPFYYHMKFAFLVWLQLPPSNGSRHLYEKYIRPFLLKHQATLDQILNYTSSEMAKLISAHQPKIQYMKALLGRCSTSASQMITAAIPSDQHERFNATEGLNDPADRRQLGGTERNHDD